LRKAAASSEMPTILFGCLPIKLEIEFGPRATIIPVGEMLDLAAPQWSLRKRRSSDRDAHSRLARDVPLLCDCFSVSDDTASNEALAALVLTREQEIRVTLGISLPPYIVLCAVNANVRARGSTTFALIANTMMGIDNFSV
jgi:hypothetical protein